MDTTIYFAHQATQYYVLVMICALLLFFLSLMKRKLIPIGILIVILSVLNALFGYRLTNYLIYKYGKHGTALVTGVEKTINVYNDQPIMEYRVFITTDTRETVSTTFKSTTSNIYPMPKTGYSHPRQGVPFPVKYVTTHPDIFIIVPQ